MTDRNGKNAIGTTTELKSVVLPDCIECIEDCCFEKSGIQRVIIPKSIKSIGKRAFYDCNNLIRVILLEGLESIGEGCFSCSCNNIP